MRLLAGNSIELLKTASVQGQSTPSACSPRSAAQSGHEAPKRSEQEAMEAEIKEIRNSVIQMEQIPGLKVHICSLVAPDSPPGLPWMPVYIHSKLMIVDDVFTTHGSANINTRSMQVDSELNIIHEWGSVTEALRKRLFALHAGSRGTRENAQDTFDAWTRILRENNKFREDNRRPLTSLIEFYYGKATMADLD